MASQYIDMNTLRFQLHDVHQLEKVMKHARFEDHDKESMDIFLDSVKDFADKDFYPYFREMDEQPAYYDDGKIITHPQVGITTKKSGELGLIGGIFDYDEGGLQIPHMVYTAAMTILEAANNHLPGYPGLTMGASELIVNFGNDHLKETYVPNMIAGQWAGTMCLTEPQAGSSLSDVASIASPTDEDYYKLKGQKIFISGGDHEHVDNFVHLLLARIEGAPAGIKGISLFVVPKKRPTADGRLESNDVLTAGDFQKMGQKGYCTTHLVFGENEDCRAWLVGEPNQGLKYMFKMMNGARIAVGRGGAAVTIAAYLASLQYAKERPQGRRVLNHGKKDPSQEQTLIINHADVRRMLLLQKAIAEGSLSLVLEASHLYDVEVAALDKTEKENSNLLLELLTPIVKTYPTEMGCVSIYNGVQVLGGYGFCSDFVLQQYYRDIRIFPIYEGTTGIQSIDLLGRKITMKGGAALKLLAAEMMSTIKDAQTHEELKPYAKVLDEKLQLSKQVLDFLLAFTQKGEFERYLSDATVFMDFLSTIVIGWQWLKMAVKAKQAIVTRQLTYPEAFYESKIHTMKFYFKYEMNKVNGLADTLMDENVLTIPAEKEVFVE